MSTLTLVDIRQAHQRIKPYIHHTPVMSSTVLNDLVPLSKLMAEQITGLRTWAKGRARCATTAQVERRVRKLA